MSTPSPANVFAAFFSAADPEPEADPEAGLGHEYDGAELHPGTPEYEAEYAEYQAWIGQPAPAEPEPEPEPEAEP